MNDLNMFNDQIVSYFALLYFIITTPYTLCQAFGMIFLKDS